MTSAVKKSSLILYLAFLTAITDLPTAVAFDQSEWNNLVTRHVRNGKVDYAALRGDQAQLRYYLDRVARIPIDIFADYARERRLAIWINVYNATVIQTVLKHYPVGSIDEIPDFWQQPLAIAGMQYSLIQVKENIVRRGFRDERATLALVSALESSPPLFDEAFAGERLDQQLREHIRQFLTDPQYNQIENKKKKLFLSPLFKELAGDFVLGYQSGQRDKRFSAQELAVLGFIRLHVDDPDVKQWIETKRYKLRYLQVDRRLNEVAHADDENH